jgi:aspartate/methionine/tyrosine aminotransferase
MHGVVGFYKENTEIIAETFTSLGFNVYGAKNAPYVWVHFPGRSSWDVFAEILEKADVVTTPGSGFGPGGEGFVRVSAFEHREHHRSREEIKAAVQVSREHRCSCCAPLGKKDGINKNSTAFGTPDQNLLGEAARRCC